MKKATVFTAMVIVFAAAVSCGPKYVRGTDEPGFDEQAMSTGLDKKDLENLFDQNLGSLMESAVVAKWKTAAEPPLVSLFPIANETSEHIRDQLDALASKMETKLINGGFVTMVDHARQNELIAEVQRQQSGAFDETQSAEVGRQLGAKYFLTGKVYDSAEKTDDARRVQYFLFMKIVEVETGAIRWQNEANLTKGVI